MKRNSNMWLLGASLIAMPASAFAQEAPATSPPPAAATNPPPAAATNPPPAAATNPPPAAATNPQSADHIQDIVVTANRIESQAQKTPISLNVYTGADLVAKGVINVQGLAAVDPSLGVVTRTGESYVAMRGIASTDLTEIGDPAVPISRDGFFTNRGYSVQASMYDISRVEVLKGPQGTLNGRNSTGGLINIITHRPDFTHGGYLDASVGNYGAVHTEGALNLALSSNFAIRISGVRDYHRGYREVTDILGSGTERGDDSDLNSGRIQLAWNPIEALSLWASYQHDHVAGVGDVTEDLPLGVYTPITNAKTFPNGAPTSVRLNGDRVRWEIKYDALPGGLRFIYAGGYDTENWHHALDFGPVQPTASSGGIPVDGVGYPAYVQFIQHEQPKTWNHEIRFSNDPASRLFVQAGYFRFQEKNALDSGVFDLAMTGPFVPGGPMAALSQAGQYGIEFQYPRVTAVSNAVFGYLAFKISDQLKFSAGARETWDHKTREGFAYINLPALVSPFIPAAANPPPTPGNGDVSGKQPTFHVGLDWTPTNHSLIYVKYDTGYKPGGFNSNGVGPSVPYQPEKVSTAEIGTKNRFLDNKLEFNIDAFYTRYIGYQGSEFSSALGGGSGVFNVGRAKIYGAETEIIAQFDRGGRIDFNATALHTAFGQGISIVNGANVSTPIGGNRLPNAPSLSFTAGLQQAFPVFGGSLTGRIEGKYSSHYFFSVFNTKDAESFAYMTGNLLATYKPEHGGWQLEAYVRNFTNKIVLVQGEEFYTSGFNAYEFAPPRTYGIRASVKF